MPTTKKTASTTTKKAAASRSGNPAKKAAAKAVVTPPGPPANVKSPSDVKAFKKRKQGISLELPSGLVVLARRVDLQTFVRQGDVPNALLPIVEEALNKGQDMDASKMVGEQGVDMNMVNEMFTMVNSVVMSCVVEPKIYPTPIHDDGVTLVTDDHPDAEQFRRDDMVYIDEVDAEDQMFIFQWTTGGTSDVASFRSEAQAALATLEQSQGGQ